MGISLRSQVRTLLAIIAATAQIALCGASLVEARFGPDARAHVEAGGIHLHHAHDDTDCAACTGRHLLATSQLEPPVRPLVLRAADILPIEFHQVLRSAHYLDARSRAPPVLPG
jgi:hypothetical protein